MKDTKGITMIALVVIITVLLLLTGTAIYSGTQTLQDAKRTAFVTELKMIKEKVNSYSQAPQGVGSPLSASQVATMQPILASENIGITSFDNFLYFNQGNLENLGLAGVKQKEVLINFTTKMVISVEGISIKGKQYYTLGQLGEDNYQVQYNQNKLQGNLDFDVSVTKNADNWKVEITNVSYPKNVNKSTIRYRYKGEETWKTIYEPFFISSKDGIYEIEVTDSAGNTKSKQVPTISKPEELDYKEGTLETGIVVTDKRGNEFVWVPVENVIYKQEVNMTSTEFADEIVKQTKMTQVFSTINVEQETPMAVKINITDIGKSLYEGVLYDLYEEKGVVKTDVLNTYYYDIWREPGFLKNTIDADGSSYNRDKQGNPIITQEGMQNDFNQMVERVNRQKGFYVARYEASYDIANHIVQSKANQLPITLAYTIDNPTNNSAYTWYGLYMKAKELTTDKVQSHMIWKSQYDQIMIWMKDIKNITDDTKYYILNGNGMGNNSGSIQNTGNPTHPEYEVKHIYDLGGNLIESTLGADSDAWRILAGTSFSSANISPATLGGIMPRGDSNDCGLRIVLY